MKRYVGLGLLAAMIVSFMVGTALAGTLTVNSRTVGVEGLTAVRDIGIAKGANNINGIVYTLSQDLTSGNLVELTMQDGLAFTGVQLNVCSFANTGENFTSIAQATPGANSTVQNFQVDMSAGMAANANVLANNVIWFADSAANCGVASNIPVRLTTAAASVGAKNVQARITTSGGIEIDAPGANTAANVTPEFAFTDLTTRNMTIDYLGDPGNGSRFVSGGNYYTVTHGTADVLGVNKLTAVQYGANNGTVGQFNLSTNATITIPVADQNFTGVNRMYVASSPDCVAANSISNIVTAFTTPVVLQIAAANLPILGSNAAGANHFSICAEVNGTTELAPRTLAGTHKLTIGTQDYYSADGTYQNWTINGFQAYVPHMRWNAADTAKTFVRFVNRDNRVVDAQVAVQVPGVAPVTYELTQIPANGIATFNARDIAEGNGITSNHYAALFTLKTSRDNVYADSYYLVTVAGETSTRANTLYENPNDKTFELK